MQEIIITTPTTLKTLISEALKEHTHANMKVLENENYNKITEFKNQYYTRAETAKKLSISLPTLGKYVKKGIIECHRIGNRVLFKSTEIEKAIKQRKFK